MRKPVRIYYPFIVRIGTVDKLNRFLKVFNLKIITYYCLNSDKIAAVTLDRANLWKNGKMHIPAPRPLFWIRGWWK